MLKNLFEEARNSRKYAAAIVLYILTVILSVMAYMAARRMVLSTHAAIFPVDPQTGSGSLQLVNVIISLGFAVPVIGVIIGGFEYHHRRVGEPGSWWFFSRTLAVELGILILALYI